MLCPDLAIQWRKRVEVEDAGMIPGEGAAGDVRDGNQRPEVYGRQEATGPG